MTFLRSRNKVIRWSNPVIAGANALLSGRAKYLYPTISERLLPRKHPKSTSIWTYEAATRQDNLGGAMTDLRRLNVSLTKHGAHKIAALLRNYDKDDVLNHLVGSMPGINIEVAQAKKTLSANKAGKVPNVWADAKKRGSESIDALVLIAVIFSHHKLIAAMQNSTEKRTFAGRIKRGKHIDGKAFTNFAHIIEELGFSTEHSPFHIDYNVHKIFQIPGLNELAKELLSLKLKEAGWDGKKSIVDEAISLGFQEVFSVSEQEFRDWLSTGRSLGTMVGHIEDADFFFNANDQPSAGKFSFKAGHKPKKIGTIVVLPSKKTTTIDLLHNEMQNSLCEKLIATYGEDNVSSEHSTGRDTCIDIVLRTRNAHWFYEIKTDTSVKACIRQAIPQLLEYAYWHGAADIAERLIIVGPSKITKEADIYLAFLRKHFGLAIYYEQYCAPKAKVRAVTSSRACSHYRKPSTISAK